MSEYTTTWFDPDFPPSAIRLTSGWEYLCEPIGEDTLKNMDSLPEFPPGGGASWRPLNQRDPFGWTDRVEYWVRVRLPDRIPDPGSLYINGYFTAFSLFLSNSRLVAYEDPGTEPANIPHIPQWYIIDLPAESGGKILYIWRPLQETRLKINYSVIAPSLENEKHNWILPLENFIRRSIQRGDLGYLALSMIFLTIGLITFFMAIMRRENRDIAMFFFSAMSVFFGFRYMFNTSSFRFWMGGTELFWNKAVTTFGYLSGVAAFSFFRVYLGRGWKSSIHIAAWTYILYSCVAIPLRIIYTDQLLVSEISNILVIGCLIVLVANILNPRIRRKNDLRGLLIGSLFCGIFVILDNLRGLGLELLPFSVEWLGMVIIYFTVGLMALRRYIRREQNLIAIRQELDTARQIQLSILPRQSPVTEKLAIASRYVPMEAIAGDFFDYIAVNETSLGILVADVSGHGIPAALIASMVKVAFQAQIEYADDPARVLSWMNQILSDQLGDRFVTAGYSFIDTGNGELRYSGAAHPPLLIRQAVEGKVLSIENNGLMIGPFPEANYSTVTQRLGPGDRIMMYTDGIPETMNMAEVDYGDQRLRQFLLDNSSLSAEEFIDRLLVEINIWSGLKRDEPATDDLTVVIIDLSTGD